MGIYLFLITALVSACSKLGEQAPDFRFTTLKGTEVSSQNLSGKIIVLNVWATWCGTCIREMPELNKLYTKYESDTSIVFLALCDNNASDMDKVLCRFDFLYPQVSNASQYSSKLQTRMVKTYPQNVILDENFKIVFEVSDGSNHLFGSLDSKIQELKKMRN